MSQHDLQHAPGARCAGDARPSDRAGPVRRVGLLSVHTSPLEQPGTGDSGGLNVYLVSLAARLAARGIAVDVFTRAAGADLPPTVALADDVRVHHLRAGPPGAAKAELASHLCAFYLGFATHPARPHLDVVHGHYWMSGWVGRHARRRLGLPFVQTFHTLARAKNARLAPGDTPEPALRVTAEERVVAGADAIVALTAVEAALLRERYGASRSQVRVVPPGVDLDVFSPAGDRNKARAALGGGRIVLFVGRLQPLKAPDVAVRTVSALRSLLGDDDVPTRLVVVGGPSGNGHGTTDPTSLRRLAASLGVADRVAFLAPRRQEELAALYRAADVVLVPSHSETFGLVALEAQACGTPVVATAVDGLVHAVGPGAGALVTEHDPVALAQAAAPYLTRPRVREAAGRAGRRHAEGFAWHQTVDQMVEIYDDVLRGCASTRAPAAARGA